jgi:hypothetical protein
MGNRFLAWFSLFVFSMLVVAIVYTTTQRPMEWKVVFADDSDGWSSAYIRCTNLSVHGGVIEFTHNGKRKGYPLSAIECFTEWDPQGNDFQ